MQVAYYHTCPRCGAHLDPGEICDDCRDYHQKEKAAFASDQEAQMPPYHITPPKRAGSPILHDRRYSVKLSGRF